MVIGRKVIGQSGQGVKVTAFFKSNPCPNSYTRLSKSPSLCSLLLCTLKFSQLSNLTSKKTFIQLHSKVKDY